MGAAPGFVFLVWGFAVPRVRHELGVRASFLRLWAKEPL